MKPLLKDEKGLVGYFKQLPKEIKNVFLQF